MGKRRAGSWSRRRARERRKELIRRHWRLLLGALAVIVALGAAAVFVAAWLVGTWLAWLVAGALYAALIGMWITVFGLVDPVACRWLDGAEGESSTARQLRSLERSGWRAVHNIMLETGDIDHVAVGPGGVVAAWMRGLADVDPVRRRGVRVLHGGSLADELGRLDRVLDVDEIDQIHNALEAVARGLDVHHMDRRALRSRA